MSTIVETYAEVRRNYVVVTPKKSIDVRIIEEFPGLQLADEHFHTSAPVHLKLGGDLYSKIIRNGVSGGASPIYYFWICNIRDIYTLDICKALSMRFNHDFWIFVDFNITFYRI